MAVHSESLFHFTRSIDGLLGILANGFYPYYCPEAHEWQEDPFKVSACAAYPMVCFCDIPLSQISTHQLTYGNYGIGMSKAWRRHFNLNPVIYCQQQTFVHNAIGDIHALFNMIHKAGLEDNSIENWGFDNHLNFVVRFGMLLDLSSYVKLVEGPVFKRENNDWDPRPTPFYREREWRVLPDFRKSFGYIESSIDYKTYQDVEKRNELNKQVEIAALPIFGRNWSDIQYIILDKDSEVPEFIKEFTKICKRKGLTDDQIQLLLTRVKTTERIQLDY